MLFTRRSLLSALAALTFASSCGAQVEPSGAPPEEKGWKIATVAFGMIRPWGMTWLPDGRVLVTGKEGPLYLVENGKVREIVAEGMPDVFSGGQGALMDVALHPDFARNKRVYFTLSTGTGRANHTVLARGTWSGESVTGIETIYQVQPLKSGGQHFGSRLAWLPDKTLLMSIGDGGNPPQRVGDRLAREQAQNLATPHGSILRLTEDGKPAPGNPLSKREGALPEIYSYGHRNIQGLVRDAQTGRVWATEHGPRGGDELNLIEEGQNYGWPVASLGADYRTREPIGATSAPGMVNARVAWTPSTGASGLAVYSGPHFPAWRGSLFSGGLATQDVRRVELDAGGRPVKQTRFSIGERVRDVRQGPDGFLYLLTDEIDGRLLRIEPDKP